MSVLFIRILSLLLLAYFAFVGFIFFVQDRLIFPRENRAFETCPEMKKLGALPQNREGTNFYSRVLEQSFGSLIYFHGNGGTVCDRAFFLKNLYELPYNFYFYEYPGYAGDLRKPSEKIILEEALKFFDLVKENSPVTLFGESLGSGVATYVASQRPADTKGLILQAPFTSLADIAQHHYWYIPAKYLIRNAFYSNEWAKSTSPELRPLILAAELDKVIPFQNSLQQKGNFPTEPIFKIFSKSDHNNMSEVDPMLYWGSISDYLEWTLMNSGSKEFYENKK